MKPCPSCSAPVRHDSTFCTKCGFKLDPGATAQGQVQDSLPTGQFAAGAVVDGKYQVDRILGEGGMGRVYLAKSIHTEVEVVIKAVRPELANRADVRERTLAEGKALARIDNPNVVQLKSVVVTEKELLLVMQYIEGENLEDRILRHTKNQQPMSLEEALRIFRQILKGVAAAHAEGVIHRDIKPANVLIRAKDGVVKVTDFGIAKPEEDAQEGKGKTKGIIGTVNYMSPEQVTGRRDLDRRVDIYALGIVLFEMLTGLLPFDADNTYEIMKMHVDDPLPSATVGRAHLPPLLDGVLQKACAKDREHRYADCHEFLEALEGMEDAVSGGAATAMEVDGVGPTIPEAPPVVPTQAQPMHPTPPPMAAQQFVSAIAHGTQPSGQRPITEPTPYGAPHPGYAQAHTGQRHGTITGQAAELPASREGGGKGWVIPVVLASVLASGITVAVVAGFGPFAKDETTEEEDDDEPRRKKKKKAAPAASASASSSATPEGGLASLQGEWVSTSGNKFTAVLVGDRLEFQIVDATPFANQNYVAGEARLVLREGDEPNKYLVEDRVRPAAKRADGTYQQFSPESRATCLVAVKEVDGVPLMAERFGKRLDVEMVSLLPKPNAFQVGGGKVVSCRDLTTGTLTKLSVPIGFRKMD